VFEKYLELALRQGADQAEIYVARGKSLTAEIEKKSVKTCSSTLEEGAAMRTYINGGLGLSYTTILEEKQLREMVERSVSAARAANPDPEFKSLPEPEELRKVPDIFDSETANTESWVVVDLASEMVRAALQPGGVESLKGAVSVSSSEIRVENTLGLEASERRTRFVAWIYVSSKRDSDTATFYDYSIGVKLGELDPVKLGEKTAEKAVSLLGGKKVETMTSPVLFEPQASASLIGAVIAALNADLVQRRRSFMTGLKGRRIAGEALNISESGRVEKGFMSRSFDDEGVPTTEKTVLRRGFLETYLYDTYTANKEGVSSTGNCYRGSFRGLPTISASNLRVEPGNTKVDSMLEDIDRGLIVSIISGAPNLASGDFSEIVRQGFYIEKGEIVHPIKYAGIGFNLLDFLSNTKVVSKEYVEYGGSVYPYLLVDNIRVAG